MDNSRGESRRDHGGRPRAATSGAERRVHERDRARSDGVGSPARDAASGAPAATSGPLRRRPTDTHVSQEQRDAARDRDHASAPRREAPAPAGDTRDAAPCAPRGPRPWDRRLFCSHDARTPFTATCAACFLWHEFKNVLLPCGHHPDDPSPSWCDVCRFYFEDLARTGAAGSHVDCPAGSPRPAPSRGDRARIASVPTTRTGRTTSSSAGTRWTARGATACRAWRAGTCTARRAGCT